VMPGAAQTDEAQRLAGLHGKRHGADRLSGDPVNGHTTRSEDAAGLTKASVIERPTIFSTRSAGEVSATRIVATRRPSRSTVT